MGGARVGGACGSPQYAAMATPTITDDGPAMFVLRVVVHGPHGDVVSWHARTALIESASGGSCPGYYSDVSDHDAMTVAIEAFDLAGNSSGLSMAKDFNLGCSCNLGARRAPEPTRTATLALLGLMGVVGRLYRRSRSRRG